MTLSISAPDPTFLSTVAALCFDGGYQGDTNDSEAMLLFAKEHLVTLLGDKNRKFAEHQIRQAAALATEAHVAAAHAAIAATRPTVVITVETVE